LSLTPAGARVHDTRSGETAPYTLRHDGRTLDAEFSRDGRMIVTGGQDRIARVWDSVTGRLVGSLLHDDAVRRVGSSPDGRFLFGATVSSVHLWRDRTHERQLPVLTHGGNLLTTAFSSSGRHILTLSEDGVVRIFELEQRLPAKVIKQSGQAPAAIAALTQLLAGRQLGEDVKLQALGPATLAEYWRKLHTELKAAAEEGVPLLVWHRDTARAAESNQMWFAAGFHWDQLLQVNANDREARQHAELARSNFAREMETASRPAEKLAQIPARATNTPSRLLDLSRHYNTPLNTSWLPALPPSSRNDLSALPTGVATFNGVEFDVRGVIQLSSDALRIQGGDFPVQAGDIPVHRVCRRLHFLQGAVSTALGGTPIGSYIIHYEDGQTAEIKIIFGRDVREWWSLPTQQALTTGAAVAWEGSNPAAAALGFRLRLFQMQWINPRADSRITHLDFRSSMESSAPFLLAITVEP
jgi:hypothetical protein